MFNVASGVTRRIGDILDALMAMAGVTAEVRTGASLVRRVEIPAARGDASAARAVLGWAPVIAWEQTLAEVLADWRARVAADPGA